MKKKPYDTYDPAIYPRLLWVAVGLEGLDKYFDFLTITTDKEGTYNYDKLLEEVDKDPAGMVTCPVIRKSDDRLGVIVVVLDLEGVTPDMIPHESVHVADYFCNQLGMIALDFKEGNEHYAYLAGWAGGCISKTVSDRLKDIEYDN